MSRQWRIEFPGAMYHIISRGNEGNSIFSDDIDRKRFIDLLSNLWSRFGVEIHAWVLMPNHYHLLVKTRDSNISKSMQWFGANYTRYYNIRHKRSGHLFQGRFKSLLVENDRYLLQLSCYIHRNPLRANLVERLLDYKWSSYRSYAYGDLEYDWLVTDLILSQFKEEDRYVAYRKTVQAYSKEQSDLIEDIQSGFVFGSKAFALKMRRKYSPNQPDPEIPAQSDTKHDTDISWLMGKACEILRFDPKSLNRARRVRQEDLHKRDAMIYLLWNTGAFTNKEIGRCFGLTYSAVSRRICQARQVIENNEDLKAAYNQIKSLIKM